LIVLISVNLQFGGRFYHSSFWHGVTVLPC